MAIMIPAHPPKVELNGHAERELWERLRDTLSDDFRVYHSLPYLRQNGGQGEVDFLVVHRELGMLVVECKGSGIERVGGQWYRALHDGRRKRLAKSPAEQARGQIEHIVKGLGDPMRRAIGATRSRQFPLLYGWAVAFPFGSGPDKETLDFPPEVLLCSRELTGDLEGAIGRIMAFHGAKLPVRIAPLSPPDFEAACAVISPDVRVPFETRAASLDRERESLIKLSEHQQSVVRGLMANPRVRVQGGAGTGKTLLALHAAREMARRGKRVLLTCFNIGLAEHLAECIEKRGEGFAGSIEVTHFHGLCERAATLMGRPFGPPRGAAREEVVDFWMHRSAAILLDAIVEGHEAVRGWDAIIVDEGQDFGEDWWAVLDESLADPAQGHRWIFYDERQTIFGRPSCVPDDGMLFMLSENFRTTHEICEDLNQLIDSPMHPHALAPAGEPTTVYPMWGPSKTQKKLAELLEQLTDRDGVALDQVVILSPHSPERSTPGAPEELGGVRLVYEIAERGQGVLFTTIQSFKGLEAEVVILVDVDVDDDWYSQELRYVAASRAMLRLYVFAKSSWPN